MERVALGTSGRTTTRLGYGCSSLMGAMGRAESLAMLESAFDAGVRHFDVAPLYGFGQAESCLGEFLGRHRGEVTVTTKYGIPAAKNSGFISMARSIARPLVKALPGLKQRLVKVASSATASAEKASFTAAQAKESLERSLRELRTERVDVWLLHEVTADDLRDSDELLRLLEDSVAAGKLGAFGVGSERARVEALAVERAEFCGTMQFEWSVMDAPVALRGFRIHHRALTDNFRALHAELLADTVRCADWSAKTGADLADREALASLMLKAALVENPESVILFSSKNPAHIRRNVGVADDAGLAASAKKLYELVRTAVQGRQMVEVGG